ncbi:MAG: hypothetical protein KA746_04645 [Pyrinomonadaceae bacterium]|nr:hypothetical protein [Pyrinomonadaceae bacterium]MBP6214187.1 hypothetical protein [Pyrinomonadaceae bacterium]
MNRPIVCVAILLGSAIFVSAQQTIFNVPTTDVLGRGQVYVEFDAAFKVDKTNQYGRFSSFVPRVVVGLGGNVEVGLNVSGNIQPGSDSTVLVPSVKWKFFENKKKDTALIAGTNIYIPIRNRSYTAGTYSYLAVSKTINKTRLTAGGYVASKNVLAPTAVRTGGLFGVEQSINSKFSIAADWISGRHAAGYFTPGVIYKPHPKVTTYFSYSIGNDQAAKGNHYFLFELGYNFN